MSTPPPQPHHLSRRTFLSATALAGIAVAAGKLEAATPESGEAKLPWPVLAFSKAFIKLGVDETADLVAEIGWDGIECPVRSKDGQIAPERVEEDLPKMVEALQKRGKIVGLVTTEIVKADPMAERVLRTMAKLGLKKYRFGFVHYTKGKPVEETVRETAAALKDLAALNKELGLQGGFQNHSGSDYFAAPVWDLWTAIKDLPSEQVGSCFDIGHATLEGGLSWPVQVRLMQPRWVAVYLKDFRWENMAGKGWQPRWCAFGEGMVQRSFVTNLKTSGFAGPVCQHHEYPDLGEGAEKMAHFKKDLATLREWLA